MHTNQSDLHQHAIVFIDHHEVRVLFPDATQAADDGGGRVVFHRVDKSKDGHHHLMQRRDLDAVADKLRGVAEILIAGPSTAKLELHQFLKDHHADIAARVVEVVALDHLTQGEVKDIAREKFKRIDLWR